MGVSTFTFTVTDVEPPPVVRVIVAVPRVLKGADDVGVTVMVTFPPAFRVVFEERSLGSQSTLAPADTVPASLPQLVTTTLMGVAGNT